MAQPEDIIEEVQSHMTKVVKMRLGKHDRYLHLHGRRSKGTRYLIPNPEPIAKLLHGLREDERLDILHTDNGNPFHYCGEY